MPTHRIHELAGNNASFARCAIGVSGAASYWKPKRHAEADCWLHFDMCTSFNDERSGRTDFIEPTTARIGVRDLQDDDFGRETHTVGNTAPSTECGPRSFKLPLLQTKSIFTLFQTPPRARSMSTSPERTGSTAGRPIPPPSPELPRCVLRPHPSRCEPIGTADSSRPRARSGCASARSYMTGQGSNTHVHRRLRQH
jgi:hypothetical protein